MTKQTLRDNSISALSYLDNAASSVQMIRYTERDELFLQEAIMIEKLIASLSDKIKVRAKIKPEAAEVFLPAYPKSEWRHIKARKPRVNYRHISTKDTR